jgi:hypothetical protein
MSTPGGPLPLTSGTTTDTGTNEINNLDTSSVITLRVILTSGPLGSQGGEVSVDYGDVVGTLVVSNHMSTPGGPLPLTSGTTTDTGSRVEGINAVALPPFEGTGLTGSNQTHQLGTVTFSTDQLPSGVLEIRPDANGLDDVIRDLYGNDITSMTTFNSAFLCAGQGSCLNPTPTPTATPTPSPTAAPTATPTPTPPLGVPAASGWGRALLGLFVVTAGALAIARRSRGAGAAR